MKMLYMVFGVVLMSMGAANAMNDTAKLVRNCEGLFIGTTDNYVLKCKRSDKILAVLTDENNIPKFFAADNNGDKKGTFLEQIPTDGDFVYVNVATNMRDPRYENQTCYRFITEIDKKRDGFYAVEICEYERPDHYL